MDIAHVQALFRVVAAVLLFATLTTAATTDVLHRKVYNWLTYPAIALGLALGYGAGGLGEGLWGPGLISHLAGFALGFGLLFAVWWSRAVGGGEVKLAGAVGAIVGFPLIVPALFWSSLVGAIMGVWVLVWRGKLLSGLRSSIRYALSFRDELPVDDPAAVKLPYGVAIAFGTILAWFLHLPGVPA